MQAALDGRTEERSLLLIWRNGINTDTMDLAGRSRWILSGGFEIRRPSLLREVAGFELKALMLIGILSIGSWVNSAIDNARLSARGVADQFQHRRAKFWKNVWNE